MKNSTNSCPKFGLKSHILVLCLPLAIYAYHIFCIGSITFFSSGFPLALEGPWTELLFHVVFMGSLDILSVSPKLFPLFLLPFILTLFMFTCCKGGIEGGWFCCWGLWGRGLGPFNFPDWWSNMEIWIRLATKCNTQIGWVEFRQKKKGPNIVGNGMKKTMIHTSCGKTMAWGLPTGLEIWVCKPF